MSYSSKSNGLKNSRDAERMDKFPFILVVVSNDTLRREIEQHLVRHGCFVMGASTLAFASELADENDFDAMIADLTLPDGDSCDLMSKLAAKRLMLGVSLSPRDDPFERLQSKLAGFHAHLTKPFDQASLVRHFRQASE